MNVKEAIEVLSKMPEEAPLIVEVFPYGEPNPTYHNVEYIHKPISKTSPILRSYQYGIDDAACINYSGGKIEEEKE